MFPIDHRTVKIEQRERIRRAAIERQAAYARAIRRAERTRRRWSGLGWLRPLHTAVGRRLRPTRVRVGRLLTERL